MDGHETRHVSQQEVDDGLNKMIRELEEVIPNLEALSMHENTEIAAKAREVLNKLRTVLIQLGSHK